MTKDEADSKWGAGRWLPMPRFEMVQASGKHRPIDDGKRFGHNSASGFTETIECCSAFQPVVHARALAQQAILQGAEAKKISNKSWRLAARTCLRHIAGRRPIPVKEH